jgi:hypothetical protein
MAFFSPFFLPVVYLRMYFRSTTTDTNVKNVPNSIILHYRATTKYLIYCKCVLYLQIL